MISIILKKLDIRDTEYTKSAAPCNDNYKIVLKMIDHQEELRKIAESEASPGNDSTIPAAAPMRRNNTLKKSHRK